MVFSNACLQWVPDHEHVLPSLLHRLRAEFEQEVLARICKVYPLQADGTVLIGFPRFFFLAVAQ